MSPAKPLIGIPAHKSKADTPPHRPLYALHSSYVEGVLAGGGAPLQIPHAMDFETLRTVFDRIDGLLLAGGGDVDPSLYGEKASEHVRSVDMERDEIELTLVRWALQDDKPLFAICRGIQVMNVALGGSLYQDIATDMPGAVRHDFFRGKGFAPDHLAHDVQVVATSRIGSLLGGSCCTVNSLHHQGIKRLASELTAVGHAPDGLVEAVEVEGHSFAVGVQWHPEALAPTDPVMLRLFEGLTEAAADS